MCSICLLFPSELEEVLHMFITQEFVTNCFVNYEELFLNSMHIVRLNASYA